MNFQMKIMMAQMMGVAMGTTAEEVEEVENVEVVVELEEVEEAIHLPLQIQAQRTSSMMRFS